MLTCCLLPQPARQRPVGKSKARQSHEAGAARHHAFGSSKAVTLPSPHPAHVANKDSVLPRSPKEKQLKKTGLNLEFMRSGDFHHRGHQGARNSEESRAHQNPTKSTRETRALSMTQTRSTDLRDLGLGQEWCTNGPAKLVCFYYLSCF